MYADHGSCNPLESECLLKVMIKFLRYETKEAHGEEDRNSNGGCCDASVDGSEGDITRMSFFRIWQFIYLVIDGKVT